jgi:hypothetical protein
VQVTRSRGSFISVVGLMTLGLVMLLAVGMKTARAETGQQALVLGSTVTGGAASAEGLNATGNGFTVTVVDDATWGSMTAAQFSEYQMIIIGDPTCGTLPAVVSQNAAALADAVMARSGSNTKVGNRVLIGTDPVYHYGQGGNKLVETAIDFVGVQEGASGLYLDFSCVDADWDRNGTPDGQDKLLPLLTADPSGTWTQNQSPPCGGDVSLISNAAQFSTLTSSDLRGWGCSVHETFPTFPTDWTALAIATDVPTAPTCGTDVDTGATACGEAYVLISGSGIVVEAPNLSLDPPTATNPVGTPHTVTATVTNPDDSPRSGVVVSWVVTGANASAAGVCIPAGCTTGADGKVSFTYTGVSEGDDTINAAITVDGSRQTATASKTWVSGPPPVAGQVVGKGSFATGKAFGRVNFEVDANSTGGSFGFQTGNANRFVATSVEGFTRVDNTASFHGSGTWNGASGYTYEVSFVDNGTPGRSDTIDVTVVAPGGATVLSSGGPQLLKTGNVVVSDA